MTNRREVDGVPVPEGYEVADPQPASDSDVVAGDPLLLVGKAWAGYRGTVQRSVGSAAVGIVVTRACVRRYAAPTDPRHFFWQAILLRRIGAVYPTERPIYAAGDRVSVNARTCVVAEPGTGLVPTGVVAVRDDYYDGQVVFYHPLQVTPVAIVPAHQCAWLARGDTCPCFAERSCGWRPPIDVSRSLWGGATPGDRDGRRSAQLRAHAGIAAATPALVAPRLGEYRPVREPRVWRVRVGYDGE